MATMQNDKNCLANKGFQVSSWVKYAIFVAVASISSCDCYAQVIANKPINASYALKRSFISAYHVIV